MSWDRFEYIESAICACGKGTVIKHCYQEDDDWNRSRNGCTEVRILCQKCKSQYHFESVQQHFFQFRWMGDGIVTKEYLVPNGLRIPAVKIQNTNFNTNPKEAVVNIVTKEELVAIIEEMKCKKYSTQIELLKGKEIINICKKKLKTRSFKKIIPFLQDISASYDTYKWNPITIAEYQKQEAQDIKKNQEEIAGIISQCYELTFQKQ